MADLPPLTLLVTYNFFPFYTPFYASQGQETVSDACRTFFEPCHTNKLIIIVSFTRRILYSALLQTLSVSYKYIISSQISRSSSRIQKCWWNGCDGLTCLPRPLEEGEFLVSFFAGHTVSEIKSASELRVLDRNLRTGDICKRAGSDDPQSGAVIDARVKARLVHAISGKETPGWKTKVDLEFPRQPDVGEYVTYDNWIGQVFTFLLSCRGQSFVDN